MATEPTPHPNSYWVHPGRLLAGEFPGSKHEAEAREKLQRFLAAGINCCIDLTHEVDGMVPYDGLLRELAATLPTRSSTITARSPT
jgi:hypothetical protein